MSNLELYRKVISLKNYLELHELEEVAPKKVEKCIELVNQIFETLERRKVKRNVL